MPYRTFIREFSAVESAYEPLRRMKFEAVVTAADLRYLHFLHLTANLHLWLTDRLHERFAAVDQAGPALDACVVQDDFRARLLARILRLPDACDQPPSGTPPPPALAGSGTQAWAYYGFSALIMAELCGRTRPPDDTELVQALAWLARGYRAESTLAFDLLRASVASGTATEAEIRETARTMILTGEHLLEGFLDDARGAVRGRLSKSDLIEVARGLRDAPGIGDELGSVLEAQMKRLEIPWATRKLVRLALRALVRH